ncbi:MAG: hypothetical protein QHG94_08355, partial [Candidatus Methanosuratincola sp.]|nr:hypothetical protein [Candidatus Methanosuratincola sp.]
MLSVWVAGLGSEVLAAGTVEIFLGEKRATLSLLPIREREYLPLDKTVKVLQGRYRELSGRRVEVMVEGISFLLREGIDKVSRDGREQISLSAPILFVRGEWAVPMDLFSIFLRSKYGDKVWWDKEGRRVRVGQTSYSVIRL